MVDITSFLAAKYRIQQEQADTAQRLAQAQGGLTQAQTALLPGETAARNYATRAQGTAALGQANLANTSASLAPSIASSESGLRFGQTQDALAHAGFENYQTRFNPDVNQIATDRTYGPTAEGGSQGPPAPFSYNSSSIFDVRPSTPPLYQPSSLSFESPVIGGNPLDRNHFDAGTSKVPGQGDGKTDTVPSMLAPGEAVLNRGAAEHLGRDTISLLNAIGAHKMGLNLGHDPGEGKPDGYAEATPRGDAGQGYAWGTPSVPPAPGQTQTNGTWGAPPPPAPTPNSDIRNKVGKPGVPRVTAEADMQGYAKGTSKVPDKKGKPTQKSDGPKKESGASMSPYASAHTPDGSGMSPGIIQALMQMSGGGQPPGAGMPPPGSAPPMPMPMPMVGRR
jgi:hypothetical protein